MTESTEGAFCLRAAADDGVHPVLTGVQAQGRLDGLLFSLTLRQTYRNTSRRTLEVVYTFPLPLSAVLLGFAAEFSGRRVDCEVMPREQAEEVYENALADGDAPALLEAGPDGLYTANIGNLKHGEEVVLEIRFAQLVAFEQGRLRLAVPMTIAPRYGNPALSGLQPHQVPEASLQADYPLELSVWVAGADGLAGAALECPTHPTRCAVLEGGMRIELAPGARLDRDVVLLVTPESSRPHVLTWARDGAAGRDVKDSANLAPSVALAAFEVPAAPIPNGPQGLALKLLVDCSGSMGGDSIESARRALMGVAQGLTDQDEVSFTRFGSSSELVLSPRRCTPLAIEMLVNAVEATDASLGGTEMESALLGVFALPSWLLGAAPQAARRGPARDEPRHQVPGGADVLLITDGEVWDTQRMIESARRSGHRVFVIGVGTSPAEGVLRHLAEATGGACEFATPGEALEAAAARMLQRMRQGVWAGLRVDWGAAGTPHWEPPVQQRAFAGDTLLALAGFGSAGQADSSSAPVGLTEVRLLALGDDGHEVEIARISTVAEALGDDLPRIAAARRVAAWDAEDPLKGQPQDFGQALALQHRLITRHTHGVLVHKRADQDKPKDESLLHRVQSMLAAGWGNTGRVASLQGAVSSPVMRLGNTSGGMKIAASAMRSSASVASLGTPSVWRSARTQVHALVDASMDDIEIPAFLRKQRDPADDHTATGTVPHMTLAEISGAIADHLARGELPEALPDLARSFTVAPELQPAYEAALAELRTLTADEAAPWLLLALWIAQRPGPDGSPAMAAVLVGPVTQASLTPSHIGQAWQLLEQHLGGASGSAQPKPKPGRKQRLAAAMSGSWG